MTIWQNLWYCCWNVNKSKMRKMKIESKPWSKLEIAKKRFPSYALECARFTMYLVKKVDNMSNQFWLSNEKFKAFFVNSLLFHLFPATFAENSWKTHLSSNFAWATLRDPIGVEMGCTPAAWDLPFSTRKCKIIAKLGFITVFCNVTGKRWNRILFFNY